jgi:tetratricopeptide (TPR) repeat protein
MRGCRHNSRKTLTPVAIVSVAALLTACHSGVKPTEVRPGASGKTPEYLLSDILFNDTFDGIHWTIPASLMGHLENNANYTAVLAVGDQGASFLSVANMGSSHPDEYAVACAIIRGFNVDFPSTSVLKLPSTDHNGIVWQHYICEGANDKGPYRIYFDITFHDSRVVGLANVTLLRGPQRTLAWPCADMYKGISFYEPESAARPARNDGVTPNAATRINLHIARSYLDRSRPAEALPYINAARILIPGDASIAEMNADALILTRDYAKILPEINILAALFPNDSALAWREAFVYAELGRREEALRGYDKAIHKLGDRSEDAMNAYLGFLDNAHELGPRLDEVAALCEQCGSPTIQLYLARACLDSGDSARARKIIDDLIDKCEAYPQLAEPLVSLYLDMQNYDEALRISERVATQGNPAGDYLAAATLMREGRFKEAGVRIAKSLERLPNNRSVRELSDAINAQLGKADTSTFQKPIEPVLLPDNFRAVVPDAPANFEGDFGSHSEYSGVMYDFEKNKPLRSTLYGRFRVGTVSALRKMNDLRFPFDPLYERVYVNYLRVFGPDGNLLAEGKLSDYYTANDSQQVLMSQKKELHLPIPALVPGCTVEYATSFETLGNQDMMPFKLRRLAQAGPTQIAFAGVRGDTKRLVYALANGAQELDSPDGSTLFFYATFPEPLTMYPETPPETQYIPSVWLGSSDKTWAVETKDYFTKTGKLMDPDPVAAAKAKLLLGDNYGKEDAVRILSGYVRESLTYQGLAFGVRAMIPNTCEDILRNRYGDCKDHSFLLMQMLRAAGVKAYLALVDTTRDINTSIPDIGQFNHMIVYLPDYNGGWFIDATDKVSSGQYQPFWLEGCPCLILDPDNARLVTIPQNQTEDSGITIVRNVKIGADGTENVDETATFTGMWAGFMRNILRDKTSGEYAPALADSMQIKAISPVKNISAKNLDELSSDVILHYSYTPKESFATVANGLAGRIPASWEAESLTLLNDQPDRRVPIWQNHDYVITCITTVIPPEGYTATYTGDAKVKNVTPFLSFDFTAAPNAPALTLTSRYVKSSGIFPASARDAREAAFTGALSAVRGPIVLVKQR